jgi:hypothetical protein
VSLPLADIASLFSSAFSTSSTTSSLLDTIYGIGGAAGSSLTNPIAALQTAQATETQQVAATARQPAVKMALSTFTKAVNAATSLDQLLSNPNVMNVLLTASGMSDQVGYTALAKDVLTSNLSDPNSLANKMSDSRWLTLAQTYNFATNGLAAIQNPKVLASVSNAYAQAVWDTNQDSVTPGLSNALYFISQAPTITSVMQIAGDPTLFSVVTTALGIPEQVVYQGVTGEETAISSQLDVSRLKDPNYVKGLAEQYLMNTGSASATSPTDLTTLAVQANGILA